MEDYMPAAAVDNSIYKLLLEGILSDLQRIRRLGVSEAAEPELEDLIRRIQHAIER